MIPIDILERGFHFHLSPLGNLCSSGTTSDGRSANRHKHFIKAEISSSPVFAFPFSCPFQLTLRMFRSGIKCLEQHHLIGSGFGGKSESENVTLAVLQSICH